MDIQLPDIDGITALAELRADPVTQNIPVIAVSASVMPHDLQRIVASGFDHYITKPINVKTFVQTIERFITNQLADRER
jgi:two-component system cell cycle response regulator DivK